MNVMTMLLLLICLPGYALQRVDADNADSAQIKLSAHEPNHLWIVGRAIRRIICKNHVFEYIEDKGHGDIFIKSKIENGAADIFIVDDQNCFYRIHASIVDKVASEIKIFPAAGNELQNKNDEHVAEIRRMTLKLYILPDDVNIKKTEKINSFMSIQWLAGLDDRKMHGDIYQLNNIGSKSIALHEKMFSQYGADVQAVAILRRFLPGKSSTRIMIVRNKHNEH